MRTVMFVAAGSAGFGLVFGLVYGWVVLRLAGASKPMPLSR